jgi:transcriptional regulator with GAF, ATPase, and Fis domain
MTSSEEESEPELLTTPLSTALTALTFQRFAVEVVGGKDEGLRVESEGEELGIGTAPGNAMVLTDRAVSRHHCVITVTARGFSLRDLDSTNGIKIARHKVGSAYLKPGSTFTIGRSKLRFQSLDDHVTEPVSPDEEFAGVLGRSPAMRRIFAMLPKVAASDSTVLLEGETGTGKTLLASAIHDSSPRATGPFVVVDCASVTPTLVESQLFGHVRGAYTGASGEREGAFLAAGGGTIFLDEVGELPLELQPKLLRVLEERVVTPVGDTRSLPVDVRVVAATNRDLREEVNRGRFRADLFYRLHVVRLVVPPLRERPDDVELLARHFWSEAAGARPIDEALVASWRRHRWSGNVRELRSAVDRAILLGDAASEATSGGASPASPTELSSTSLPFRAAKDRVVTEFERAYLGELITRHEGNISAAAREAKMDRNHLRELLRRHELIDR